MASQVWQAPLTWWKDEGNRARIDGYGGGRGHVERNDRRPTKVAFERDLRIRAMCSVVNDGCKLVVE